MRAEPCWIAPVAGTAASGCYSLGPVVRPPEVVAVLAVAVAAVLAVMAGSARAEPRRRGIVSGTEAQVAATMAGAGVECPPGGSAARLEEGLGELLEGVVDLAVVDSAVGQAEVVESLDPPVVAVEEV